MFLRHSGEPSKVSQRVLGFSGTFFEGSRARVPYTGHRRTLLALFFTKSVELHVLHNDPGHNNALIDISLRPVKDLYLKVDFEKRIG